MGLSAAKIARAAKIKKIRHAVIAYESDEGARPGLARIAGSEHSLAALTDMDLTDAQLKWLLADLTRAVQVKKQFRLILAQEASFLARAPKLKMSVKDLSNFVKEIAVQPQDGIRAWVTLEDGNRRRYQQALYEINSLIEGRERIARETPVRIGASRKASREKAGDNAAIGWVIASVLGIKGRPMLRQAAILAETLLDLAEVSEDRARRALRNVSEREWRTSFGSSKPTRRRPVR